MKMNHFYQLHNMLRSIGMSTDKAIKFSYGGYKLKGLQSPYVSHQTVELLNGHDCKDVMTINNNNFGFAISKVEPENLENAICVNVFKKHIEYFMRCFTNIDGGGDTSRFNVGVVMPDFWNSANWLNVIMPDYFSGYDDDGNPEYRYGRSGFEYPGVNNDKEQFFYRFTLENKVEPEEKED